MSWGNSQAGQYLDTQAKGFEGKGTRSVGSHGGYSGVIPEEKL